jgi:hypothetical protein
MEGQSDVPDSFMMGTWLLRLVVPLGMLLQAVYALGWAFLTLSWPADPEVNAEHGAVGTLLFTVLVAAPALLLLCSAALLAASAGRGPVNIAIWIAVAVEGLSLVSGVVSGGLLLSFGAVVVLTTLVAARIAMRREARSQSGPPDPAGSA